MLRVRNTYKKIRDYQGAAKVLFIDSCQRSVYCPMESVYVRFFIEGEGYTWWPVVESMSWKFHVGETYHISCSMFQSSDGEKTLRRLRVMDELDPDIDIRVIDTNGSDLWNGSLNHFCRREQLDALVIFAEIERRGVSRIGQVFIKRADRS